MSGTKYDNGKPPISYIPAEAVFMMAQALAFGGQKYSPHNFRKGIAHSRLVDASLRHLFAILAGEENDSESGLPHLAHAMASLSMYAFMRVNRPELNDLYKYTKDIEKETSKYTAAEGSQNAKP